MQASTGRIWHRTILRIALSSAQVFAWIFIFQFFYVRAGSVPGAVASLALTFALTHVIIALLSPLAAQRVRRGFKRLMVYGVLSLAAAFSILAAAFAGYLGDIAWGVALFALLVGVYRAIYWVPYEVAHEATPARRPVWTELLVALAPAVAGLALTVSPIAPVALLSAAAGITLLSLLPLVRMRDVHEGFAWGYRQTFHQLFAPERRRVLLESVANGVEMAALLLLWPLVVFLLLHWSYPMLGIVLTVTYIVAIALRRVFQKPLALVSMPIRALLAASAWILRLTVGGAVGVVLVDTYFYVGSRASARGIDMSTYEHAADNNTFVDEYTALKEIGMAIGRIAICLVVAMLASAVSLTLTFIAAFLIAAAAAALSVYLAQAQSRI